MAPLKKPKKLYHLTTSFVKHWLLQLVSPIASTDYNGQMKAEQRKYLEDVRDFVEPWLPAHLSSDFIEQVFQDPALDTPTKFAILQVLHFADRTTKLSLGTMRESHYEALAQHLFKSHPSALEHLDLKGIWLKGSALDTFCSALRRMSHLKQLNVPYIANDLMIETVSKKCAHLTSIDVSGSNDLSEEALLKLGGLRATLKSVNLGNYSEQSYDSVTVAKLILALPNLESLGGYQHTGQAIHILKSDLKVSIPTKLKYLHDKSTNFQTMASIQALCPDLSFIFLNEPAKSLLKYLKPLKSLRKLKLSKVNCEEIHDLLEVMGEKLTSLELVCLRESLNLSAIAQSCPNLLSLEVFYSMAVHVANPIGFRFPKLQKLVIYSTGIRGFDTQQDILLSCPLVKKLTLCKCDALDDEIMYVILGENPLLECEDLCLLEAPGLTIQSARLILMNLPNVHFLGRLDSWQINWSEVEELRFEIGQFNLDVKLWETFSTLERQDAFEEVDELDAAELMLELDPEDLAALLLQQQQDE